MSRSAEKSGLSYKDAGVDIDAGDALVDAIAPMAARTARSGTISGLGGFGALFDLKAAGFRDPILVSGTDGVGTKLKIAIEAGKHDTVGIDLVAMCVNDIVVQGAEPLFFLDYFATGKLDVAAARAVITGIAEGCQYAGCALAGGETAEMPGFYSPGEYDLAGFAVGAVERDRLLTGDSVRDGDILLGLSSSGVHSNGFSLVRKIVDRSGIALSASAPFDRSRSLADALLAPTRIYVKSCLSALRPPGIRGLAHITGGGLVENLPRVFPESLAAEIDARRWPMPAVFPWLKRTGGVAADEMARTFNLGIGMVAIVAPDHAQSVAKIFMESGESVYEIGRMIRRPADGSAVALTGLTDALGE